MRQAVVDKFNEVNPNWKCQSFDDLHEHIEPNREGRIAANAIINSLKICDPAVGSGHFLVSALNELIAIKSELGILQDRQEKPKRITAYQAHVINDELMLTDEDGEVFYYDPSDPASQIIQQALFEEKREIIENCLYGVDLNPKSVEICRLRLWIELLKNAYYYKDEKNRRVLQTLPNIDINIKSGNSLASNQPVTIGRKITIREGMRKLVAEYKNNEDLDFSIYTFLIGNEGNPKHLMEFANCRDGSFYYISDLEKIKKLCFKCNWWVKKNIL